MADEILTETHGRVRLITLNRPEAKNSVNSALGLALVAAIEEQMPILVVPAVGSAVLGFALLRPYAKNMVAGAGAYNAAVAPTDDGVSLLLEGSF